MAYCRGREGEGEGKKKKKKRAFICSMCSSYVLKLQIAISVASGRVLGRIWTVTVVFERE